MQRLNLAQLVALCVAVTAGLAAGQYLETTIPLSYGLAQAVWNPQNDRLYVSNVENGTVVVIDGATNQVVTTIDVACEACYLCLNSTGSRLYCAAQDTIDIIDAVGDTLLTSFRVREPCGMICDGGGTKLYVVCHADGLVRVYNAESGVLIRELGFGQNSPVELLAYPGTSRIFCATGAGGMMDTVFVLDSETDSVVARAAVGRGPGPMCWNPANGLVYVDCADSIYAITPAGDSVVAVIPLAHNSGATSLCAIPSVNKLYAARSFTISVIDCGSQRVIKEGGIRYVSLLACDTKRDKVYCTCRPVEVYDARADSTLLTVPVDGQGYGFVAWNSLDSRMYMTNPTYDEVIVIRDTTTGIAEPDPAALPVRRSRATVAGGRLPLEAGDKAFLLDLAGRRVAALAPGGNDVHGLRSGVYFVHERQAVRKVVIRN